MPANTNIPKLPNRSPEPWWLLVLVLVTYGTAALYATHYGYSILGWDDSEYVGSALDTADHLAENGLLSWPVYIARAQQYSKPPLYVNSLALFIELMGRSRAMIAVGALAATLSALLGLIVFTIMRPLTSFPFAILSMLTVTGLPGISRWMPTAFTDLQLTVCAAWVMALLCIRPRARCLGLALGLGLLAKTTFPFFVAGPLAFWWWKGGSDFASRTRLLLKAGCLAAIVAALWYVPNFRDALHHAGSSYEFLAPEMTFSNILQDWLQVAAYESLSWVLVAGAVLALAMFLAARKPRSADSPSKPFPRFVVALLLLGALPLMALSIPSTSISGRYWLPSSTFLALVLLLSIHWIAPRVRFPRTLLAALTAGVLAQWLLTQAMLIPQTAERARALLLGPTLAMVVQGFVMNQPYSLESVDMVLDRVQSYGPDAPSRWYLSGDNTSINVARLRVVAKARRIPVRFAYADFFSWSEQETLAHIRAIENEPAIVVVAEPIDRNPYADFYIRRAAVLKAHLNEFELLETNALMSIYATPSAFQAVRAKVPPVEVNFDHTLQLLSSETGPHSVTLRLKLLRPLPCSYKVFIHATAPGRPLGLWDQKTDPPFCQWQTGADKSVILTLPPEYSPDLYRLEIGFFDESDAAHNWPPLKLTTGGNAICFGGKEDQPKPANLPARTCVLGRG
jgi:4-amino-4-deoxy-L-arabinose transferase-like glycosyltransferase